MKNYLDISIIKDWEDATTEVANHFVRKYFGKGAETYWVADCIGDVFYVNDRFFNVDEMVDFIKYSYTENQVFKYYNYNLKCHEDNEVPINIKNWIKLK